MATFSEKVNAISSVVAQMSQDPAERLGLVTALVEIYRHEIKRSFSIIPVAKESAEDAA